MQLANKWLSKEARVAVYTVVQIQMEVEMKSSAIKSYRYDRATNE